MSNTHSPRVHLALLTLLACAGCGVYSEEIPSGVLSGAVSGDETLVIAADSEAGDTVLCARVDGIDTSLGEGGENEGVRIAGGVLDAWDLDVFVPTSGLPIEVDFQQGSEDDWDVPDPKATLTLGLGDGPGRVYSLDDAEGLAGCTASVEEDWAEGSLACVLASRPGEEERSEVQLSVDWSCSR